MKALIYLLSIAFMAMLCVGGLFAQTLEPIGGPYTPDSNTVVLMHFDGDYTNAAATQGKTAAAAIPHSTNIATKLSFLSQTGPLAGLGKCIRIDNSSINDSTYLTLNDTASLKMTGSWTIEGWVNVFTFGSGSSDWRWVPRFVNKPGDDIFYHTNYSMEMWGDSRLFLAVYYTPNDAYIQTYTANNMCVPGQWVHLTFIRDTARAFIALMVHDANKNLKGFYTQGFDKTKDIPKVNKQMLHMGWAGSLAVPSYADSWLDGFIDEVRISNVVRNFAGPPVIQGVTVLPNQSSTLASYPVSVTVFPLNAGGSMTSVVLKYRADTVSAFSSVTLTPAGGNKYSGAIPGQAFGKTIQYYYVCTDNNGLKSLSPVDAEATTNPSYYSFMIYQPNVKTLDVTFEEGPTNPPIDHSTNNAKIVTRKVLEYTTDHPIGGGSYALLLQAHAGVVVDSNWIEAVSPFLAAEEFCLDTWVKADSVALHATRIIINPTAENDWNNANFELSLRNGAPGNPVYTARYWRGNGTGAVVLQDTNSATNHAGKWRHIILERRKSNGVFGVMIRDENDALLYKQTKVDSTAPLMAAAPLRIGRSHFLVDNPWYVAPFRGRIDNVKLYNYPAYGFTSGVIDEANQVPLEFSLSQNFPNPFNPSTEIEFTMPRFQQVSLVVYDLLGRKVKTLVKEERHAGQHRVTWNGTNDLGTSVATGVYFYQLKVADATKIRKMLLLR